MQAFFFAYRYLPLGRHRVEVRGAGWLQFGAGNDKRPEAVEAFEVFCRLSMTLVFVFRGFGILCNQGDQGVLLAVGELAEALK